MPRYRLRYQATDLEMPVGEFVIGRSSSCNLALDDAMVSRRHAVITVTPENVTVRDLGSRNGVVVNGQKIDGEHEVRHLDRISIGSQEMVLVELGQQRRRSHATSELRVCERCRTPLGPDATTCPKCGASVAGSQTLAGATLEMSLKDLTGRASEDDDETKQAAAFQLISTIADKALAMKRYDEAERMLGKHLDAMVARARKGERVPDEQASAAVSYALALAEGLGSARWLDWIFELSAARRTLLGTETIERLHQVVRKARYDNARALRAYLAELRELEGKLSPSEKFALRRLEGLERVIVA